MVRQKRKNRRIDIGSIRRKEIVQAAVAVIAEQGIQHLSLSEIEKRTGMSRGQLTYYFKTKEKILLAVFDRLLEHMGRQAGGNPGSGKWTCPAQSFFEFMEFLLRTLIQNPPANPEFRCLQHTFLSQIGHRRDFRRRLAGLYEEWRSHLAQYLTEELRKKPAVRKVSPRAMASVIQAIFHGLAVQNAADPLALDRVELVDLCRDMLMHYLWNRSDFRTRRLPANGVAHRRASRARTNGVNHE
jgi:AcrR family transcriptional regulator